MVKNVVGNNVIIERMKIEDFRSYHISSAKIKDTLGLEPKKE